MAGGLVRRPHHCRTRPAWQCGVAMPHSPVPQRRRRQALVPENGQLPMAPAPTVPAILAPSMVALNSSVSGMGFVIAALKLTALPVSWPSKIGVVLPSAASEPVSAPLPCQGERRLALADRRAHHQVPGAVRRHVCLLCGRACIAEMGRVCQEDAPAPLLDVTSDNVAAAMAAYFRLRLMACTASSSACRKRERSWRVKLAL